MPKLLVLVGLIDHAIFKYEHQRPVTAKFFALILGKIISFSKSYGPILRVMSPASHHLLCRFVIQADWNVDFLLSLPVIEELKFCRSAIYDFNGQSIMNAGGRGQ